MNKTKIANKTFRYILIICLLFSLKPIFAAEVSIRAKLDSVNVLMGKINTLYLEVVENQGQQGRLSVFSSSDRAKGYATVCGDSVELGYNYKVDTTLIGSGKIQINYEIPVQVFDSGTYTLPKIVYYSGSDSAVSNSLTFNVYPPQVTAEDEIAPMETVNGPDNPRFYDWMPDWLLDFWWLWLVIFLAISVFLYGMKNYKKKGIPFIAPKEQPKPWTIALDALQRLKNRKLWEQGMEKEYFTELTDILREYLYSRFSINAMEMTTRQIIEKIMESDLRDKKDYVKQILNVADFVKFAKVRPLPADSIAAYDNAVKFVEETIPSASPVTPEESQEATPATKSSGKIKEGGEPK